MISPLLVDGLIVARAMPAVADGSLRELRLDVHNGVRWSTWSVLLATTQTQAEAGDLLEGEAVAFAGFANRPRFPEDPLARRLTAERALALRALTSPLPGEGAPAFGGHDAFSMTLDRLQGTAFACGALAERARIKAIMEHPDSAGRAALAWQLAQSGLDVKAALEALSVQKIASAFSPIDSGAARTH